MTIYLLPLPIKLFLLLGCAVAVGWFIHSALICAAEGIYDWRDDARWAAAGALCIVGVLVLF